MKLKTTLLSTCLVLLSAFSVSTNANVIWDESIDGDTGLWWSSAQYLGTVSEGDQILGYLEYWDGYSFDLDASILDVNFLHVSGFGGSGIQLYSCSSLTNCTSLVASGGSLSASNPEFSIDISGLTGTYAIGFNGASFGYNYSITFGDEALVSEPGMIMLMMLGLLGMRAARQRSNLG